MAVGLSMLIFFVRWETSRGSTPRPSNDDESVRGALLGFEGNLKDVEGGWTGSSGFGLYENREDIIWPGGREV